MDNFSEILSMAFMQRAIWGALIIGVVTAVVGTFVVLRGLAFIGASIAHASFGGVALGLLLGVNPVIVAILFCIATGLSISVVSETGHVKEDTSIGIFFAATMAFGIFLLGFLKHYVMDVFSYLFGDVLAISRGDLIISGALATAVIIAVILFMKEFTLISFDRNLAHAQGFPVRALNTLLMVLIALTISVSIKVVGIIMVSALLVIPAATANQIARSVRSMMAWAVLFSLISTQGGLLASYVFDTPSGATIVLLATFLFFIVWSGKAIQRRIQGGLNK